jgi:lysozyme family protein
MSFATALEHVLAVEGGYANSKDDAGGETFRGISRKANPNWEGWLNIDIIKKDIGPLNWHHSENWPKVDKGAKAYPDLDLMVQDYYKERYYQPVAAWGFGQLLTDKMFDLRVNMSPFNAGRILQRAINQVTGATLAVDGKVGPQTLAQAKGAEPMALLKAIAQKQEQFYLGGVVKKFPRAKQSFINRARWIPEVDHG